MMPTALTGALANNGEPAYALVIFFLSLIAMVAVPMYGFLSDRMIDLLIQRLSVRSATVIPIQPAAKDAQKIDRAA